MGWGWDDNVPCTCTVHIYDATPVFLSLYGDYGGDGVITFFAHVHIFDATPIFLSLEIMVGWGWDDSVPFTCAHCTCLIFLSLYGDYGGVEME